MNLLDPYLCILCILWLTYVDYMRECLIVLLFMCIYYFYVKHDFNKGFVLRLRDDNSLVCGRMLRRYFSHIWIVWFVLPFSLLDFFAFYPLSLFACHSLTLLQRAPAPFLGWLCLRLFADWRYIFSLWYFLTYIYLFCVPSRSVIFCLSNCLR